MTVYGFEIKAERPGFDGRAVLRKEITAHEERDARLMIAGWLAVEGYEADGATVELIADGCTFLEAGRREAVKLADALVMRFNATVEEYDNGNEEEGLGRVVRVTLANGSGVSLKVGGPYAYSPPPTIDALAFIGDEWDGEPVRNVTLEDVTAIMERLA